MKQLAENKFNNDYWLPKILRPSVDTMDKYIIRDVHGNEISSRSAGQKQRLSKTGRAWNNAKQFE